MAPQTAIQEALGQSQQMFAEQARARREELVESGQCRPFTVVNFNPVGMKLEGELQRYSIPSPDDSRLPSGVLRVTLDWDGRERIGHCMTIREPHVYGRNIGASWHQGGGPGDAIPQREVMHYLPVGVAYNFLEHFSPIFVTGKDGQVAPPPKDARKFYGVLAFEGDVHTLEKVLLEEDPARRMINVPLATVRQVGKLAQRSYKSIATPLDDYLERMFHGQLRFADATISRAQQKWNGTDEDRKDISASDRIWYRWAIRLGYATAPKPGEKTWLNELLTLAPTTTSVEDARRECQACRQKEPKPNTPFCPNCNAPIDTVATFMAGFPVAESWLHALPDEKWNEIAEEMERRKARAGGIARGPYKGKGGTINAAPEHRPAGTGDQIPAASSIALPGEETGAEGAPNFDHDPLKGVAQNATTTAGPLTNKQKAAAEKAAKAGK